MTPRLVQDTGALPARHRRLSSAGLTGQRSLQDAGPALTDDPHTSSGRIQRHGRSLLDLAPDQTDTMLAPTATFDDLLASMEAGGMGPDTAPEGAPGAAPPEGALAPTPIAPAVTLESILIKNAAECGPVMSEIPTGRHQPFLRPPEAAAAEYSLDLLDAEGRFAMSYGTIPRGGEYCTAANSTAEKVIFGGMVFWQNNGQCYLPPTQADGSACCEMYAWQPNTEGFYYDNCSMRCASIAETLTSSLVNDWSLAILQQPPTRPAVPVSSLLPPVSCCRPVYDT